jgi:hypothetical protein
MKERRGKVRCPRRGPGEEVIPGGRAGRPNINSKGDICVGFRGSTHRQKRAIGRS